MRCLFYVVELPKASPCIDEEATLQLIKIAFRYKPIYLHPHKGCDH